MKIKIFKLYFLLSLLLVGGGPAFSKEVSTVVGKVNDSFDSRPLPQVSVAAIQLPDSVVTNLVLTDGEGNFEIKINPENEILRFAKSGWNTVYANALSKKVNITLQREETDLPEFTVKATRASMKGKPGKFVYTPGDLVNYVKNAREVLNYVPLLESPTQIFSKTKPAVIYINGEEQMMDQGLLIEKLKTLPANKIKSIELIMNPGAEYDGNTLEGGIINIILEDDLIGWNAFTNFDTRYIDRRFSIFTPNVLWFYQNHNLLLSAYVRDSYLNNFRSTTQLLQDEDSGLLREINEERNGHDNSLAAGVTAEYKFGKSSLGVAFDLIGTENKENKISDEKQFYDEENLSENMPFATSSSILSNNTPLYFVYVTSVRFKHRFNNSLNLSISFKDGRYKNNNRNIMDIYPGLTMEEVIHTIDQSTDYKQSGDGLNVQLSKGFGDGSTLSVRAQAHYDNTQIRYTALDDRFLFDYGQWAQAFTVSYNKEWTDFFSSRLGLREEYVNRKITGDDSSAEYKKGFLLWLPNVSLSFVMRGGLHNINVDWATTPSYPRLSQLNPHKTWYNSSSYSQGNPEMPITTTHSVSINYSFLNDYFISCKYYTGKSSNSQYMSLDNLGNTVYTDLMNEKYNIFSLDVNYSKSFFKYRWQIRCNGSLKWNNSVANVGNGSMAIHSLDYYLRLYTRVVISRRYGLKGDATYSWTSGEKYLTYRNSYSHSLYFSISKDLWKNAEISANIRVPLTSGHVTYVNASSLTSIDTDKYNRDISGSISFSWFFGKNSIERVENITVY